MRPYDVLKNKQWYRVISCSLVHGSWMHLFFNGITYYFFAISSGMAELLGGITFLTLYLGSLIFSAIPSLLRHGDNPVYRSLGASGAISGLVLALAMMDPEGKFGLFFIIPMPAWLLGLGFIIFSFVASIRGLGRIAHDAHLFGALGGGIFIILLKPGVAERFILWLEAFI